MKNTIFIQSIKKDLLHPFNILINRYNHLLAKSHLENYPQIAIFSFDHIGLRINHEGRYENRDLFLILDYLKSVIPFPQKSTAIDIGANIGNHSVYFAEFFESVFAFEPNPRTFALLKVNSEFACLNRNITCFNYGLSDQNSHLFFKTSKSNTGESSIVDETFKNGNNGVFLIDVKRADEIEQLFERDISLIKIDVEGHDLPALKGAKELIRKNKPIILFEQHADDFINGTSNVLDYLKELNYKFLTIEQSFYFGDSILFHMFGLILRSVFGYKLALTERDYFHKKFYSMIIAIPK
jgi:FkbM family methyltransferase